jgi:hypothetical protein
LKAVAAAAGLLLLWWRASPALVLITGYSRNAIVHQGRLDPGVELIQKPLTQEQLTRRIRGLLDSDPNTSAI